MVAENNVVICPRCSGRMGLAWKIMTRKIDGTHHITLAGTNSERGTTCKQCADKRCSELIIRDGR